MNKLTFLCFMMFLSTVSALKAQTVIEGHVFESGNREFLNHVHLRLVESDSGLEVSQTLSNSEGYFSFQAEPNKDYRIIAKKEMFEEVVIEVSSGIGNGNARIMTSIEMFRAQGGFFEVDENDSTKRSQPVSDLTHRIVIHFTIRPLPANHDIYQMHDDVYEYISREKYRYYLIGAYSSEADAHDALEEKWLELYPNAYIMTFRGDQRIN